MRNLEFVSVVMKNFKCHEEMSFDFNNRFVVVTGENGAGKTSIIDAIMWALYDKDTHGTGGDNIVRHKSGKNTEVILTFKIDESEYVIKNYRKHKKYKNKKFLYKDGKEVFDENANVSAINDYIENIILPQNVATNSLIFSQYVTKSFPDLTYKGQREILDNMLNFNIYEENRKKMSARVKMVEGYMDKIQSQIPLYQQSVDETDGLIVDEKDRFETMNTRNKERLVELKDEIQKHKTKLLSRKEIDDKLEATTSQREELVTKLLNLKEKFSNIVDQFNMEKKQKTSEVQEIISTKQNEIVGKYAGEKENINMQLKDGYKNLQILTDNFNDKKDSFRRLIQEEQQKLLQEKNNLLNDKVNEEQQNQSDIKVLSTRISNGEEKVVEIRQQYQDLTSKLNQNNDVVICPTCGQEIKDQQHLDNLKAEELRQKELVDKYTTGLAKLKEDYEKLLSVNQVLRSEISDLENQFKEKENSLKENEQTKLNQLMEQFDTKKVNISSSINELENKIQLIDSNQNLEIENMRSEYKANLEKELLSIQEKYSTLSSDLQKNISELESKRVEFTNALEDLSMQKREYDELEHEIKFLEEQVVELKKTIKEFEITHNERIKTLIEKKKSITKNIDECGKKIELAEKYKNIYTFWVQGFSDQGIKAVMLDECIPILNERSKYLSAKTDTIRVTFDSQTQTSSGELRNKFNISALNVKTLSEYSQFSAGETRLTNIIILLSLRYLLEQMNGISINILLLDEILDALDEENANLAVNIFRELSRESCVMLITHTLKDFIEADEVLKV